MLTLFLETVNLSKQSFDSRNSTMRIYVRFVFLFVILYLFTKVMFLEKDAPFNYAHSKYLRHKSMHDTPDGDDSSEHPKIYEEIHLKQLASERIAENNYSEGKVIETLPADQTSRLFGIKAGKLVKAIRANGSVEIEQRIGNKYRLVRKVGEGKHGKVYLAIDIASGKSVAIKFEDTTQGIPYLYEEDKVYQILEGEEGFPTFRWSGRDGVYSVTVTDLLGPSLATYFVLCNKRFNLKTVLIIADQLIRRLEYIHSKGFVHRDVRPENFLVGNGDKNNVIYAIDFCLVKVYRRQNNDHIPYIDQAQIRGTTIFASDNKLRHIQQSRRDDMESIGYMLMYFLRGSLPWQKTRTADKNEKSADILLIRKSVTIDILCKGYPKEFAIYLKKCQSLQFDEEPNYYNLRLLFSNLLKRLNLTSDYMFDWQVANGRCRTIYT